MSVKEEVVAREIFPLCRGRDTSQRKADVSIETRPRSPDCQFDTITSPVFSPHVWDGVLFLPPRPGRQSFFCPSPDPSLSPPSWHLADPGSYSRNWKPSTAGAQEVIMISPDPRLSPGQGRWAESYETKYERRQETRESRRCRPNVTTCRRQVGKALRTQQREQFQRARQQQFFRRRNLELEGESKAQAPRARAQGPSRRTGQAADPREPLSWANRISSPRQQVGHGKGHTALAVGARCGGSFRQVGGLKVTEK